jgi:hypothetical protein
MGIDEIANAKTVARSEREIALRLALFRIDERRGARLRATHQVGLTAAGAHPLEDHLTLLTPLPPGRARSWRRAQS